LFDIAGQAQYTYIVSKYQMYVHSTKEARNCLAKETTVETVRSQIHCGISCASKNDCCSAIFEPNLMNCYQHPHCLADKEPGNGTRMFKSPGKFEF
jgi:hypothetical protein